MNFDSERNKPIFVVRPKQMAVANSRSILDEAILNRTAIHAKCAGDVLVKIAAANRLSEHDLLTVDAAMPDEVKELVVTRLEIDRDEKFEFIDGSTYTGQQAAEEVRNGTPIGQYFLGLEKETLRIVQDAYRKGQLK